MSASESDHDHKLFANVQCELKLTNKFPQHFKLSINEINVSVIYGVSQFDGSQLMIWVIMWWLLGNDGWTILHSFRWESNSERTVCTFSNRTLTQITRLFMKKMRNEHKSLNQLRSMTALASVFAFFSNFTFLFQSHRAFAVIIKKKNKKQNEDKQSGK